MAKLKDFEWHELELHELLQGSKGPIARDLAARAIKVESAAKRYASGQGGGPNVRTGRLRGSITWVLEQDGQGPYADIGSNVAYAPFVELGHTNRGGGHTAARPYLVPALEAAK